MSGGLLEHPLTRGLPLDDPSTTEARRQIIQQKGFLRQIYVDWYRDVAAQVPPGEGAVLELGSGAGFLGEYIPDLVTSEILHCSGVRVVLDARQMPFRDGALRAVVMTDVLHHLPQVRAFFREAARCVRPGGAIVMVEPWVTPWSRVMYRYLHPEPIVTDTSSWEFPSSGPLSGANSALPWIVFSRDRARFQAEFPQWRIAYLRLDMPFAYLLSGGLTRLNAMPSASYPWCRRLERALSPWMSSLAMFACIVLERTDQARRIVHGTSLGALSHESSVFSRQSSAGRWAVSPLSSKPGSVARRSLDQRGLGHGNSHGLGMTLVDARHLPVIPRCRASILAGRSHIEGSANSGAPSSRTGVGQPPTDG